MRRSQKAPTDGRERLSDDSHTLFLRSCSSRCSRSWSSIAFCSRRLAGDTVALWLCSCATAGWEGEPEEAASCEEEGEGVESETVEEAEMQMFNEESGKRQADADPESARRR